MGTASDRRCIVLWSHPRSTSTMFERAFLNRPKDFTVLHEPMGDAWYFGPERTSPRYSPETCAKDHSEHSELTFRRCWRDVVEPPGVDASIKLVFSKDMAQYIMPPVNAIDSTPALPEDGNPTFLPRAELLQPNVQHTFLIRTPEKAAPSYYRLCSGDKCEVTGFHYFDPHEMGLRESRILFDWLERETGKAPLVIDSADLLKAPEDVMRAFCEHIGYPFEPSMLEWPSGQIAHFDKWKGWHDDAQNSTGMNSPTRGKPKAHTRIPSEVVPAIVQRAIDMSMDDYRYLRARALVVD